ncbi:hypothetical protein M514_03977 [Trichuris suis]|uniref:Uncharacterized protein n=1 Tax=Trichuris suis TaxID=68888 RepID=A0A085MCW3_9BILA|nr:hypothetical protein M513_03977 [Trichuris suis]KFD72583.1 hypothetical protein M514_03977 [Trichuris suis]
MPQLANYSVKFRYVSAGKSSLMENGRLANFLCACSVETSKNRRATSFSRQLSCLFRHLLLKHANISLTVETQAGKMNRTSKIDRIAKRRRINQRSSGKKLLVTQDVETTRMADRQRKPKAQMRRDDRKRIRLVQEKVDGIFGLSIIKEFAETLRLETGCATRKKAPIEKLKQQPVRSTCFSKQ